MFRKFGNHGERLLEFIVESFVIQECNRTGERVSFETILAKVNREMTVSERELRDLLTKKRQDHRWEALLDRVVYNQ